MTIKPLSFAPPFDFEEFKRDTAMYVNNLYNRWQDEKEYEDFEDYKHAFRQVLRPEMKFAGATKNPFRFRFCYAGQKFTYTVNRKNITLTATVLDD